MVEPLINLYHINLYRHNRNGHEPVHESDTIKNIKEKNIKIDFQIIFSQPRLVL